MRKLMPYYMLKLKERSFKRNDYSAFDEFKKSSDTVRYKAGCSICLFEMKRRRVKNYRNRIAKRVIKFLLKDRIAFFGIVSADFRELPRFFIIINLKVLRLKNIPFEIRILNFISSEINEL